MKNTRKIIIWVVAAIIGFVAIMALVVGLLTLINGNGETNDDTKNPDNTGVEVITPPPTNEEAEALKEDASKALAEQKFDEATAKYEEAKAIYDAENNEIYSSDLQLQIDLTEQQKEVTEKITEENSEPALAPTGP